MSNHTRWTKEEYERHLFKTGAGKAVAEPRKVGPVEQACQGEGREVWPKMNKLEKAYGEYLKAEWPDFTHLPQALTFRLARATSYTVDWITFNHITGVITAWETKGFWRGTGRVKIKMAARLFPFIVFIAVIRPKGKGWQFEQISP